MEDDVWCTTYMTLASALAVGSGPHKSMSQRDAVFVAVVIFAGAVWAATNLWRKPEDRWRWVGRLGRRPPDSNFGVIVFTLWILCIGATLLVGGFGWHAAASTLMVASVGALFVGVIHECARRSVGGSEANTQSPARPDQPPPEPRD
jgi:hypothetical protein